MKVVIVGGSAGGASVAARLRRLDEKAKIVILEKSNEISFATCGIPYYVGNVIKDREKLQVVDPQDFSDILNVRVKAQSQVVGVDINKQTVSVKDLKTNILYQESYDKLVLSPGAETIYPDVPGIHSEHVFIMRTGFDADAIKNYIGRNSSAKAIVVGAGFIGLEAAENLAHMGLDVSMVDRSEQVLTAWDFEMASKVQSYLLNKGVKLHLKTSLAEINGKDILLLNGEKLEADIVILAIGVKPDISLAQNAGLAIGNQRGISVNAGMKTSNEHIYALGDAVEINDRITANKVIIPLAGQAHKQARVVAENICQRHSVYKPTMGTAIVKIFNMCAAISGSTEQQLLENGISYKKSYIEAPARAGFYPNAHNMAIKLLFAERSGQILGAQIVGIDGVDKRIDVLATAISFDRTVSDLMDLDLAYAPPFSAVKDPVHIAGMVAHNMLNNEYNVVHWDELEMFDHRHTVLVDVRTPEEFELKTLETAINIPVAELRDRLHEIPKDRRVIVFCQYGKKGYFACTILKQYGFTQIFNLNGGLNLYVLGNQLQAQNSILAADSDQFGSTMIRELSDRELTQRHSTADFEDTKVPQSDVPSKVAQQLEKVAADLDNLHEDEVSFFDFDHYYPITGESRQSSTHLATAVAEVREPSAHEANNIIEVDACGLSCPGPILQLTKTMRSASMGDIVKITSTDTGFSSDVKIWCKNKGHKLLEFDNSSSTILAVLQKC